MKKIIEKDIEKNWKDRGFSFGVWIDPPGQVWENYQHDTDELFMLVEGSIELIIENKRIIPSIGEEILIPAHAIHTVKNTGSSDNRWLYGYQIINYQD